MAAKIITFLMFDGNAEEAVRFYVSLFDDAGMADMQLYGAGEAGAEGSVRQASFTLNGQNFMAIDTPVKHDFSFTPAMSLFIECDEEARLDALFTALSRGGQILMPLSQYPFSRKFAWLSDRFGVSWQLSLRV